MHEGSLQSLVCAFEHEDGVGDLEGGSQLDAHDLHDVGLGQQQEGLAVDHLTAPDTRQVTERQGPRKQPSLAEDENLLHPLANVSACGWNGVTQQTPRRPLVGQFGRKPFKWSNLQTERSPSAVEPSPLL